MTAENKPVTAEMRAFLTELANLLEKHEASFTVDYDHAHGYRGRTQLSAIIPAEQRSIAWTSGGISMSLDVG